MKPKGSLLCSEGQAVTVIYTEPAESISRPISLRYALIILYTHIHIVPQNSLLSNGLLTPDVYTRVLRFSTMRAVTLFPIQRLNFDLSILILSI
jgi:hypothetical protein